MKPVHAASSHSVPHQVPAQNPHFYTPFAVNIGIQQALKYRPSPIWVPLRQIERLLAWRGRISGDLGFASELVFRCNSCPSVCQYFQCVRCVRCIR